MKNILAKTLAVLIILVMVVAVVPLTLGVSAAWSGGRADKFSAGTGTEADPYLISSAEDLAYLAYMVNTGNSYANTHFKLINDINIAGANWDPIGNYATSTEVFRGIFDGAGYTVSGLSCEVTTSYAGLFGRIENATVKNLNVKGTLVSGISYSGAIAGYGVYSVTFSNCTSAVELVKGMTVGGIVGRVQGIGESQERNKITGCISSSNCYGINGKDVFVGGIVGAAGATIVSYCGNSGKIDVIEGGTTYGLGGGIIGVQGADSKTTHIRNCYNTGNVTVLKLGSASYAGGISGRAAHIQDFTEFSDVINCFNTGVILAKDENGAAVDGLYGSIIGHIRYTATIANCYTSVPFTEYAEVGKDDFLSLEAGDITYLTLAEMSGASAVTAMKLGEGWVANATGLPTIDVQAALAAAENPVETTAQETTTAAPVETTVPPETTVKPLDETTPVSEETTAVPTEETTAAPSGTDSENNDDGPNIFVILIIAVVIIAAGAIAFIIISEKKKK